MESGSEQALRMRTTPTILAMAVCVIALALAAEIPPRNTQVADLALLLFALVATCYLLDRWRPEIGRWAIIATVNISLIVVGAGLGAPEITILLCFSVSLAAALLGLPCASIVAVGETALIVILARQAPLAEAPRVAPLAVGAVWGMLILMVGIYRPVRQRVKDSMAYHERAKASLEEARDRREELSAALRDLEQVTRQLLMTNQQLSYARRAAEEAQGAKAAFVARVSHELRTPLNMIVGFGEMITQAPQVYGARLPQALLADLAVILRNSQHLSDLIDDVLDLSRAEAGKLTITREHTSLAQIIEDAAIAVRPLFQSKSLHLDMDVAADIPPVFCDRTRIREVIVNVLSNAGRFTERGGVTVKAWQEGESVTVSVDDSGPGIDPQKLEQLFRPFAQLDETLRRRHGGTGLGLAISKSLIELHGGRMWVQSSIGQGTTVYFSLPLNPDVPQQASPLRWFEPMWEYRERRTRPSIPQADVRLRLVVQEPGDVLEEMLSRYVHNLEIAHTGDLAQSAEELRREPAQALVINAPSVSEGLAQVRECASLPSDTPVLVCAVPDVLDRSKALGISDYLLKPVTRPRLLAALQKASPGARKVLIVDDEAEALRLFWRMLSWAEDDYQVMTASDGEQALAIMRAQRPDAVILDLVMPRMDGFRVLEQRNQDAVLRRIPVVVASALDPGGDMILSSALAVTRPEGLTIPQLLGCLEGLSRLFAAGKADDRAAPAGPGD